MGATKHYLNNLLCAAAPDDGELQDAIQHALITGKFNPTLHFTHDLCLIEQRKAEWLEHWRRAVEANTTALLTAAGPLLAAALNTRH